MKQPINRACMLQVCAFFFALFSVIITPVMAQQNLFNIPSGDITKKGKFFYQHQLNFYGLKDFESKSHLVYGLGKNWDAGLNLVDLPFQLVDEGSVIRMNDYRGRKPLYPLLMATLQKQFTLRQNLQLNVGTQAGPNISRTLRNKTFAHFTYATLRWRPLEKGFLIAGPYYSNRVFTGGKQHTVGWMFGYELPVSKKVSLMGDYISGDHKKAVSTFGLVYDLGKRTQLCVAALVPYPNEKHPEGLVLELNVFGWDFKDNH